MVKASRLTSHRFGWQLLVTAETKGLMDLETLESTPDFDRSGLLGHVLDQFKISRHGAHGPAHWARVRLHGLKLGRSRGGDVLVVELFAFLHDSQRLNEYSDRFHGSRAAEFAASLNGQFFDLKPEQLDQLCYAMEHHSGGDVHSCATIQSCWDGDRLDLGRVGIQPHKDYLSLEAARMIASATRMSKRHKTG
jgi:uncharacterized protein